MYRKLTFIFSQVSHSHFSSLASPANLPPLNCQSHQEIILNPKRSFGQDAISCHMEIEPCSLARRQLQIRLWRRDRRPLPERQAITHMLHMRHARCRCHRDLIFVEVHPHHEPTSREVLRVQEDLSVVFSPPAGRCYTIPRPMARGMRTHSYYQSD